MANLTFTMNTDHLNYDEDYSFEILFTEAMKKALLENAVSKVSKDHLNRITNQLCQDTELLVESKLKSLLSEDLVLNDKWGNPLFIGSIEDYIKKTIDDKTLGQVDSKGVKITGCTTTDHTWIQWVVEKEMAAAVSAIQNNLKTLSQSWLKNELQQAIEGFKTHTLKQAITDHLESIGIK